MRFSLEGSGRWTAAVACGARAGPNGRKEHVVDTDATGTTVTFVL